MLNKDEFLRDMEFAARRYGSSYKNAIRWEMEAENLDFDDISEMDRFEEGVLWSWWSYTAGNKHLLEKISI